jgi:hypothetical protein
VFLRKITDFIFHKVQGQVRNLWCALNATDEAQTLRADTNPIDILRGSALEFHSRIGQDARSDLVVIANPEIGTSRDMANLPRLTREALLVFSPFRQGSLDHHAGHKAASVESRDRLQS